MGMTFYIDIDDTLIISSKAPCPCCGRMKYSNPLPLQAEIDLVNKAYEKNHTIILFTGRQEDAREITEKQLAEFSIKYHELRMGKFDGIYIDATQAFKSLKEIL